MEIVKLQDSKNNIFEKVVEWNYEWWGIARGESIESVRYGLEHSINSERLPQTFVALLDGKPVGMYQLSMCDDLKGRPDIYPWLINVYVDKEFRNRKVCAVMMNTVRENAKKAGLDELFLYTHHVGLYEKYGWEFVEYVKTFNEESPTERLYRLEIKQRRKS